MRGTDSSTGKTLEGWAWIKQAITDILTTPIGSRVMLRDYGSRLFELTDSPMNPSGRLALFAATIEAIDKWLVDSSGNKLLNISKVALDSASTNGKTVLSLTVELISTGEKTLIGGIAV